MKKNIISIAAIAALAALTLALTACDSKLCYCYEGGYETEVYVSNDVPCNSMSTATRGCVERNERMDPGEVAYTPAPKQ